MAHIKPIDLIARGRRGERAVLHLKIVYLVLHRVLLVVETYRHTQSTVECAIINLRTLTRFTEAYDDIKHNTNNHNEMCREFS